MNDCCFTSVKERVWYTKSKRTETYSRRRRWTLRKDGINDELNTPSRFRGSLTAPGGLIEIIGSKHHNNIGYI